MKWYKRLKCSNDKRGMVLRISLVDRSERDKQKAKRCVNEVL